MALVSCTRDVHAQEMCDGGFASIGATPPIFHSVYHLGHFFVRKNCLGRVLRFGPQVPVLPPDSLLLPDVPALRLETEAEGAENVDDQASATLSPVIPSPAAAGPSSAGTPMPLYGAETLTYQQKKELLQEYTLDKPIELMDEDTQDSDITVGGPPDLCPEEDRPLESVDSMVEAEQQEARDMTMEGLSQGPDANNNAIGQEVDSQAERDNTSQVVDGSESGTGSVSVMETDPVTETDEIPQIQLAVQEAARLTPIPECSVEEQACDHNMNDL